MLVSDHLGHQLFGSVVLDLKLNLVIVLDRDEACDDAWWCFAHRFLILDALLDVVDAPVLELVCVPVVEKLIKVPLPIVDIVANDKLSLSLL